MKSIPRIHPEETFENPDLSPDPEWEKIRGLLSEANRPPMPDARQFAVLRATSLQRCARERRTWGRRFRDGLTSVLELLVAQTLWARSLHLAGAAAAGAFVAIWVVQRPVGNQNPGGYYLSPGRQLNLPSETAHLSSPGAGASKTGVLSQPSGSPELPAAAVVNPGVGKTTDRLITGLSATPEGSPAQSIVKSSAEVAAAEAARGPSTSPLPRDAAAASASVSGEPSVFTSDQSTIHSALNVGGAASGAPGLASSTSLKSTVNSSIQDDRLIESVQKLKLNIQFNGDDRYLTDIKRIEAAMDEVLESRGSPTGESEQIKTLKLFRQAEAAAQDGRYSNAISAYAQVAQEIPQTLLAFMAHYQIAAIEFEHLDDFGSALEEYSICLNKYPQFMSETRRNHIASQVELLTGTRENNWEALKLYRESQKSGVNSAVAAIRLRDLLERYSDSQLVGPAAQALAELAARDMDGKSVDYKMVLESLQQVRDRIQMRSPSGNSQAAAVQFAIADIFLRRLFNPRQASVEFNRVQQMNPNPELALAVRNRLQEIYQQRAVTPTP